MAQPQETSKNAEQKFDSKDGSDLLRLGVHCTADDRIKISVIPPVLGKKAKRLPAVICCVVDTSGSMGTDAVIKDANGKSESHGLSILDLVKHAIKTIVETLDKNDYLSVVSYSGKAKVVTNLMKMSKSNKKKTLKALEGLAASGQTNLWDGLFNGLEQLRKCKDIDSSNNNSAVMLFTDGLPNCIPPKGHIAMLEKYMNQYKELNGVINTYGFGYSLDTKLLNELAIKGNGNYSFIPDSGMVGTIFVNSISNFLCNVAKNVKVSVDINKSYEAVVVGGYNYKQTENVLQIDLGNIMYGQNKDIVLQLEAKTKDDAQNNEDDDADMSTVDVEGKNDDNDNDDNNKGKLYNISSTSLSYISLRNNKFIPSAVDIFDDDKKPNSKLTEMHFARLSTCDVLRECMECMKIKDLDDAQNKLKTLIKKIKSNKLINKDKYIIDLLTDLTGQGFEAISKNEFYDKWGKHYIPSLIFAHLHQYNNNFKDPGVQHYGGALFNKLRDKSNDIFIKMPAPKPSYKQPDWMNKFGGGGGGGNARSIKAAPRKPVAMSHYMNASGGCFDGMCTVQMNDNSLKYVRDLVVGDNVFGNNTKIKCVIKYKCKNNKNILSTLYNYNNLKLTPYHPIYINNEWVFPINVDGNYNTTKQEECEFVYNFILNNNHILIVNGIKCCTLAHNFKTNNVIQHEYFGTNKVVDDLKKCNGWKNGQITINHDAFKRDPESNLVYTLIQ